MTAVLADQPFTAVESALERLDAAVSPLVGLVTRTISTTHTPDEASLPNCAASSPPAAGRSVSRRWISGAAHTRPRAGTGRRDRGGARAVLGALRAA